MDRALPDTFATVARVLASQHKIIPRVGNYEFGSEHFFNNLVLELCGKMISTEIHTVTLVL